MPLILAVSLTVSSRFPPDYHVILPIKGHGWIKLATITILRGNEEWITIIGARLREETSINVLAIFDSY
jgi:hypothetical protein